MTFGPLHGVRVLEFASIGPGPFCAMLLADLGADVVRVDRPTGVGGTGPNAVLQRGRPSIVLDLKQPDAASLAAKAAECADVVIEGNRPGVMERLGLGPETLMAANERLIYARVTGYGQTGPLSRAAGHDINYLSMTGVLDTISRPGEPPRPPLNLLADFGGGALYLAFGIAAALHERSCSGRGQVIDAAIIDGAASLMGMALGAFATGSLSPGYQRNLLSGAAPFYRCYRCADDRYIAVGALEPQFYRSFMTAMGLERYVSLPQREPSLWPEISAQLEATFVQKPLDVWLDLLTPLDACITPVLDIVECRSHPHLQERGVFIDVGGMKQPAPAPRFSRTPGAVRGAAPNPGEGGREALQRWGVR